MEENEREILDTQLSSSKWYRSQSDELLKKYNEAKTEHERNRLIPQLMAMMGKLKFQYREIRKFVPEELRGDLDENI